MKNHARILLCVFSALVIPFHLAAQGSCSMGMIDGTYALAEQARLLPLTGPSSPSPTVVPGVVVGMLTMSGNGQCSGKYWYNVAGISSLDPVPFTCQVTEFKTDECTVTIESTLEPLPPLTLSKATLTEKYFILEQGKILRSISQKTPVPGTVLTTNANLMYRPGETRPACSAQAFEGSVIYAQCSGYTLLSPPAVGVVPSATLVRGVVGAAGAVTGRTYPNVGGVLLDIPSMKATVKSNSDCTVEMAVDPPVAGGPAINLRGVLYGEAKAGYLMHVAAPGAVPPDMPVLCEVWRVPGTPTVVPPVNNPPVATVTPEKFSTVTNWIQLDGSKSSDPDGDVLTYSWTSVGGKAALSGGNTSKPFALLTSGPGDYVFELKVTDRKGLSATAKVTVTYSGR